MAVNPLSSDFDLYRVMTIMGSIEGCVGVLKDTLPKLGDGVSDSPSYSG